MRAISDSEWQVLSALWDTEGASLGEVVQALSPATGWSRSTVLTYLTRMEKKGLVAIDKGGYPHIYRAAMDRAACQAQARRSFLDRVYRGRTGDLVSAFLKESHLSHREREELRALLDDMEV